MTKEELKAVLAAHKKWAETGRKEGKRADLRYANLEGADLTRADLFNTVGNLSEVKSIHIDTYVATYTADRLQIGCKNHSFDEWRNFDDATFQRWTAKHWNGGKNTRMSFFRLSNYRQQSQQRMKGKQQ